jgi:predicted translin family RNA/ssDNA-binding protein
MCLNQKFTKKISDEYAGAQKMRSAVIGASNEALGLAKQAIFAFHRDDTKSGLELLLQVERILADLGKKFAGEDFEAQGAYAAALEEYVEAKEFGRFVMGEELGSIKEVKVGTASYLGGISDVTGEILRKQIAYATARNEREVARAKDAIAEIMGWLISMNLTGYLRTKFDQAKQAMRKSEEILYEYKLRNR